MIGIIEDEMWDGGGMRTGEDGEEREPETQQPLGTQHLHQLQQSTPHRHLAPGETGHPETRDLSTFLADMEYVLASRVQYQGRHISLIQFRVDGDVSPGNIVRLLQLAVRTLNLHTRPFTRYDIQGGMILTSGADGFRYFYPERNTSILPSLFTFVNADSLTILSNFLETHPVVETLQSKISLESKANFVSIPVLLFKFFH